MKTFPKPLSTKEEQKYLIEFKKGNIKARNILIEKNLRLVAHVAKKYSLADMDFEDIMSIGTIGLIKAINTYKLDKNIKLATYASRCIDNEILMFLRKNKRRMNEISLEDTINFDSEGNELKFEDIFGTEEDVVEKELENKENQKLMINEILKLNERDKIIIEKRYGLFGNEELTQKEIANKMSISQSYISRIEKKVVKKLKILLKM